MPGVIGIINRNKESVDTNLFNEMVSSQLYMKWLSAEKKYLYNGLLAIIHNDAYDVRESFSKGDITVHFYGEIYNCDKGIETQFIYNNYIQKGDDFAKEMNGLFIIIIEDKNKEEIKIYNDRTASIPMYYYVSSDAFYISPELKAFIKILHFNTSISNSGLACFLGSGYYYNGTTIFKNVKKLLPGTLIKITESEILFKKYWELKYEENPEDLGEEYYITKLSSLIKNAIKVRCNDKNERKIGVLLSGGYDSRAILGGLIEESKNNIMAISFGTEEHIKDSDSDIASKITAKNEIAHKLFKTNTEKIVDAFDTFIFLNEGRTYEIYNMLEFLDHAKDIKNKHHIQILFRGHECFGWGPKVFNKNAVLNWVGIIDFEYCKLYKKLLKEDRYNKISEGNKKNIKAILSDQKYENLQNLKDYLYTSQRLPSFLYTYTNLDNIYFIERIPWTDNNIQDFMVTLPPKYRYNKNLFKKCVKNLYPNVFEEDIAKYGYHIDWYKELRKPKFKNFIIKEFKDKNSAFYSLFEYDSVLVFIENALSTECKFKKTFSVPLKPDLSRILEKNQILTYFPRIYNQILLIYLKKVGVLSPMNIIIKLLVLKKTLDSLVDNRGK